MQLFGFVFGKAKSARHDEMAFVQQFVAFAIEQDARSRRECRRRPATLENGEPAGCRRLAVGTDSTELFLRASVFSIDRGSTIVTWTMPMACRKRLAEVAP